MNDCAQFPFDGAFAEQASRLPKRFFQAAVMEGSAGLAFLLALPEGCPCSAQSLGAAAVKALSEGKEASEVLEQLELPQGSSAIALRALAGSVHWESAGGGCVCCYRAGGFRPLSRKKQRLLPGDRLLLLTELPEPPLLSALASSLASHCNCVVKNAALCLLRILRDYRGSSIAPAYLLDYRPTQVPTLNTGNEAAGKSVYACSHIGDRESQQDCCCYCCDGKAMLVVVADGAGGHVGGALASRVATDCALALWQNELRYGIAPDVAVERLKELLQQMNEQVVIEAREPGRADHGRAAMVMYYQYGPDAYILHVGDCRAYRRETDGTWSCLTRDDSVVQALLSAGLITEQEAWQHPDQNRLTQALGMEEPVKPHVMRVTVEQEHAFLLCCDGLWNQLEPSIWQTENPCDTEADPQQVLERWVEQAVASAEGRSDNATGALIVPSRPVSSASSSSLSSHGFGSADCHCGCSGQRTRAQGEMDGNVSQPPRRGKGCAAVFSKLLVTMILIVVMLLLLAYVAKPQYFKDPTVIPPLPQLMRELFQGGIQEPALRKPMLISPEDEAEQVPVIVEPADAPRPAEMGTF